MSTTHTTHTRYKQCWRLRGGNIERVVEGAKPRGGGWVADGTTNGMAGVPNV